MGRKQVSDRVNARMWGRTQYFPKEPCYVCGKHVNRWVGNDACISCMPSNPNNARQIAKETKQKTYLPGEICPKCKTIAERRTDTNACTGCISRAFSFALENPSIIITRLEAKKLGIIAYRTGKKCRRGHKGFRWVQTNNCITCRRRP